MKMQMIFNGLFTLAILFGAMTIVKNRSYINTLIKFNDRMIEIDTEQTDAIRNNIKSIEFIINIMERQNDQRKI